MHFYADWGYGNAFVTVRVYFDGVLRDQWAEVELHSDDLWQSHTVGGDGSVQRVGSEPQISPNYLGLGGPSFTIVSPQGQAVKPQTQLDLSLVPNNATSVAVVEWSVDAPAGSLATVVAGATPLDMKFQVDVVGTYVFNAVAHGSDGVQVGSAAWIVMVAENVDLRVELTWTTPGDPDPSDVGVSKYQTLVGSDLDLHLLHPKAAGVLFDPSFDCHFRNANPEWGFIGPIDNPRLASDDFDGTGPESIKLPLPESGESYPLAVYYWSDGGFGNVFETLRVYFDDVLMDEWPAVELTNDDLWLAFTIVDGAVVRVGTEPSITSSYSVSHPEIRQ